MKARKFTCGPGLDSHHRTEIPVQHGAMEYTVPPTDLNAVRLYRLGRIRGELKKRDYAGVLLFGPLNTRYAADSTNMQIWRMHYETRCVLMMTDGPVVLSDYAGRPRRRVAVDLSLRGGNAPIQRIDPSFDSMSS